MSKYNDTYNNNNIPQAVAMNYSDVPVVEAYVDNNDIIIDDNSSAINEIAVREFLSSKRWPIGLIETCISNLSTVPMRFFLCDDSGSMISSDGHRLVLDTHGKLKSIKCSRWSELAESLIFHANLSQVANVHSEFIFLNNQSVVIDGSQNSPNLSILTAILDGSPSGGTPLCKHIRDIVIKIRAQEANLRRNRQLAGIIIATDGESSDGDIVAAMKPLETMPVWVVVKLCTDDEKIVDFWNNIDSQLELNIDVLDDLKGEAVEVTSKNPWLTYAEPVHRIREFGIPVKAFDLLDEGSLSLDQVVILCSSILGGAPSTYPQPEVNFSEFASHVNELLSRTALVWCPIKQTMRPWINTSRIPHTNDCSKCYIM